MPSCTFYRPAVSGARSRKTCRRKATATSICGTMTAHWSESTTRLRVALLPRGRVLGRRIYGSQQQAIAALVRPHRNRSITIASFSKIRGLGAKRSSRFVASNVQKSAGWGFACACGRRQRKVHQPAHGWGTLALQDFRGLRAVIKDSADRARINVFNETDFPLPTVEELVRIKWPKSKDIVARGILGLSLRAGAFDLADGIPISKDHVLLREYHHLFPDSLLVELGCDAVAVG